MRVLVLGAGGMLGHKLCQRLAGCDVVGTVRTEVSALEPFAELFAHVDLLGGIDVLDDTHLERAVDAAEPHVVVNCVGIVKQLEEAADPYLEVALNSLLPHRLARLCDRRGARLIHISTDCVFDGAGGPYQESDQTDARDLYGRSKALGETLENEPAALTLRTSFIGREIKSRTHGLVEWFLSRNGGAVSGFAGVVYSGLTSIELTRVIQLVIDRRSDLSGTRHVASTPISKYDLLRLIGEANGMDIEIRKADEPVSDRSLIMSSFTEATGYRAPSWEEMVREMCEDPTPYDRWRKRGAGR